MLESIQIGATGRDRIGATCDASGCAGSSARQHAFRIGVQIHAAVLLRGSGDGRDAADVESALRDAPDHRLERLRPHDRRRDRFPAAAKSAERLAEGGGQDAVVSSVLGKGLVERQRRVEHHARVGAVDLDDDRGQALRARVEAEVELPADAGGRPSPDPEQQIDDELIEPFVGQPARGERLPIEGLVLQLLRRPARLYGDPG